MAGLVSAHHRQLLRLRSATSLAVGQAWDRWANVDEASEARFVAAATPIVDGAKASTATLARGMFQALDRLAGAKSPRGAVEAAIRGGVPSAEVYARSIVTARTALSRGQSWADSMAAGRARAVSTAETDVILQNRESVSAEGARREYVVGYRRVLTGESCLFCATASTQRYHSADLAPIHNNCDCDVAPIIGQADPGKVINRDVLESIKSRGPDYWSQKGFVDNEGKPVDPTKTSEDLVAVHEHGELGPVLAPAGDQFTGPSDLEG